MLCSLLAYTIRIIASCQSPKSLQTLSRLWSLESIQISWYEGLVRVSVCVQTLFFASLLAGWKEIPQKSTKSAPKLLIACTFCDVSSMLLRQHWDGSWQKARVNHTCRFWMENRLNNHCLFSRAMLNYQFIPIGVSRGTTVSKRAVCGRCNVGPSSITIAPLEVGRSKTSLDLTPASCGC